MVFYLNIFSSTVGRAKYYFLVFRGTVKKEANTKSQVCCQYRVATKDGIRGQGHSVVVA